jgi:hypothetical protein
VTLRRPPAFVWEARQAVVASRKHGPLDTRWPCAHKESSDAAPTVPLLRAAEAAAVDWDGFSSRYFRERRRHDSEARSAYAAYKHGGEWRTTPAPLRLVPIDQVSAPAELDSKEAGTQRLLAAIDARSSEGRDHTHRRNRDALALDRAGLRSERSEKIEQLGGAEVAADAALRGVQREGRDLDAEIELMPRRGPGGERCARRSPGTGRSVSVLPPDRRKSG